MKKIIAILAVLVFLFFIMSDSEARVQKDIAAEKVSPKILLKSRAIEAAKEKAAAKQFIQSQQKFNKRHIILQLGHIPDNDEKQGMTEDGITLLDYIPDKAWFAYVQNPAALDKYNVTYSGDILPEDKMSQYLAVGNLSEPIKITVVFFSDASRNDMIDILSKYGEIKSGYENRWELRMSPEKIRQLASEDAVRWVEYSPSIRQIFNDGSRTAESVDVVQLSPYSLNGTGIVVAEWDGGWVDNTHADLAGRVTLADNGTCGGGDSGTCGIIQHATHVAGTVLGTGFNSSANSGSANQWRGMAPNATLISYEWWDSAGEMTTEYNASINTYNATISQNSWGLGPDPITNSSCNAVLGNYDSDTALIDNITRGNLGKKISTVWSAGNQRATSAPYCGSLGFTYWTVTPYATAKNVISVGAVTKAEAMSTFSSWGPTDDGRIKPDIVAVGVSVKSTKAGGSCLSGCSCSGDYMTCSGTSMASPAVSGIAALIYQDYKNYYNMTPMPSTVKALLIHTAKDLNETGPDFTTGWGLVNATQAIDKLRQDNTSEVIIEANISNGQSVSYKIFVSNQSSLKITLAWDDYAGTENAATELVNNLDLAVYNTSGSRIFPWTLNSNAPHIAAAQNAADSTNNVEQVYSSAPENGTWTVTVNGTSVPQAPQSFSLVSSHPLNIAPNVTQPIITPSPAYKHNNLNGSAVATDMNNDNMSVYFRWYKNSVNIFNHTFAFIANGTNVTALLTNGNFSKHDNITLEAFANDTTSNSTFRNSSILQIQNSAPDITLASPANRANISSRNITFAYSAADNDTDAVTYYILINGALNRTTAAASAEINFTDGSYNWTIVAGDNEANATSATRFFTVDTTGPNITISSPQNRTYNYTSLNLNYTIADLLAADRCWYINVTGIRENFTSCNNLSFTAVEGTNNITLYSNDTLNNTNSSQVFFSIDTVLPTINISSPLNQTYNYTPSLNFSASFDFDRCWYVNRTGVSINISGCSNLSYINASEGLSNIVLYVNDTAGNLNFSSVNFTIDLPPAISIASPVNTTYAAANISLSYSVSSDFDRCWFISEGNRINLTSCRNITFIAAEGLNNITFYANDSYGSTNSTQVFFTVDTIVPGISFQGQTPNNETMNNTKYIFINVTASGANSVLLEWNGINESMINVSATAWYRNKTVTAMGNYTFRAWANDSVNSNVSETRWVYINDTIAPTLNLASPAGTTYTDSSVALNFNADDNIGLDKCWYRLNSGTNTTITNCTNTTITAQSGTNTLALAVNDTSNNRNETTVTFTYSPPAATTSSSGGGGGGGAAATSAKQTNIISKITPASPASINVEIKDASVSRITIETRESVSDIKVVTEKLDARPQGIKEPSGKAFRYLNITTSLNASSVSLVRIKFSVNKTWMMNNSLAAADMFLARYSNETWNRLRTRNIMENTTYYEYESESSGFSIFAIAGEKTVNITKITMPANETMNATAANITGIQCKNATTHAVKNNECVKFNTSCIPEGWTAVDECLEKADNAFVFILIVVVIIGIIIVAYFMKK